MARGASRAVAHFRGSKFVATATGGGGGGTPADPPPAGFTPITDSFNRANSTSSLGDTDTGETWEILSGIFGINTNAAYHTSAGDNDIAVVDTTITNLMITGIFSAISTTNAVGLVARVTDINNFYLCDIGTSGQVVFYKRVAGEYSWIGENLSAGYANGESIEFKVIGNVLTAAIDGTTVLTINDSSLPTGTKAGFRINQVLSPTVPRLNSIAIDVASVSAPVVNTTTLNSGTVNSQYSQSLVASLGVSPYTWTKTGSLPAGLTLSSAGVISGTPTTQGSSTFSVIATDAIGTQSQPQSLSITINAQVSPPSVTKIGFVIWTSTTGLHDDVSALNSYGVDAYVEQTQLLAGWGGVGSWPGNYPSSLNQQQQIVGHGRLPIIAKPVYMGLYVGPYWQGYYPILTNTPDWNGWCTSLAHCASWAYNNGYAGFAFDYELGHWNVPVSGLTTAQTLALYYQRGQQVMSALVSGYPGVKLLMYTGDWPGTWREIQVAWANGYDDGFRLPRSILEFCRGMDSVPGWSKMYKLEAAHYKYPGGPPGSTRASALATDHQNHRQIFNTEMTRPNDWSMNAFFWWDGVPPPNSGIHEQPLPVSAATEQVNAELPLAEGVIAIYDYTPISDFNYAPYSSLFGTY